MRHLRSVAYYTPWQLLLGLAAAALLMFATMPLWYNACTHRVDLNPAHVCRLAPGPSR